jgi:hypothetical protein
VQLCSLEILDSLHPGSGSPVEEPAGLVVPEIFRQQPEKLRFAGNFSNQFKRM